MNGQLSPHDQFTVLQNSNAKETPNEQTLDEEGKKGLLNTLNSITKSDADPNLLSNLMQKAEEKIQLGQGLIERLQNLRDIPGVQRMQKKIQQEIQFLQKVQANQTLKLNHVQCSNLIHYEFLVKILELQSDVLHVNCGFLIENRTNPLRVDIICENGLKWIKGVARNSKSLTDAVRGEASYGARSILDQAEEYVEAAAKNLCMFKCPKVVFYFSHHIETELHQALVEKGIEIASLEQQCQPKPMSDCNLSHNISTVNLDITTMLAYISNVCNGSCNWIFQEAILSEQAEKERQCPLKPILDNYFQNKRLVCCMVAYKSFQNIVSLLAGPEEKQRSQNFLKTIEIMPDVISVPEELLNIKFSGKINERSLKIFAFGLQMKAITCTSNKAFVRSTKMQGINIPVFTHQARALTEAKEASAVPL